MRKTFLAASGAMLLTGCASGSAVSTDLSAKPVPSPQTGDALIEVLAESLERTGTRTDADGKSRTVMTFRDPRDAGEIKRYLAAGFALTDIYCDRFFRETNASMRRRKFGRALTNDVGTAVGSVLGGGALCRAVQLSGDEGPAEPVGGPAAQRAGQAGRSARDAHAHPDACPPPAPAAVVAPAPAAAVPDTEGPAARAGLIPPG